MEQAEREARLREADALVGQAHGIRRSRRPGQRFDALAALKKAAAIGREERNRRAEAELTLTRLLPLVRCLTCYISLTSG